MTLHIIPLNFLIYEENFQCILASRVVEAGAKSTTYTLVSQAFAYRDPILINVNKVAKEADIKNIRKMFMVLTKVILMVEVLSRL